MTSSDDLKRFRDRRGLTQTELAELINNALGKTYGADTVSRWERGQRKPTKAVQAFLDDLSLASGLGVDGIGEPLETDPTRPQDAFPGDSAPSGPGAPEPQAPLVTGPSVHAKACEELWELIATGVGMVGAATMNHALVMDGQIIAADKEALGAAWGRLAETNDTFRRMLVGMQEGGAWLQVALVTGTTVSRCWQSHVAITESQLSIPVPDDGLAEPVAA